MPAHPQPAARASAAGPWSNLRQLAEAEDILRAADTPGIAEHPGPGGAGPLPARAASCHLAAGRLADAAARDPGGPGHRPGPRRARVRRDPRTALLSVIELRGRRQSRARGPAHRLPSPPRARSSLTSTHDPKPPLAQAQITEARNGPRPLHSANSASSAPSSRPRPGPAARRPRWLRPGWSAPHWPRATVSWPPAPSARPRPSRTPHPGFAGPGRRRGATAGGVCPPRARPCLAEAGRASTPTGGPGPAPQKTSASCTAGTATGRRRSTTLKEALGGYHQVGRRSRPGPHPAAVAQASGHPPPPTWKPRLRPGPVSGWDSLTDTEQAVASLVAQGLNNKPGRRPACTSAPTTVRPSSPLRQAFRKPQHRVTRRTHPHRHRGGGGQRGPGDLTKLTMPAAVGVGCTVVFCSSAPCGLLHASGPPQAWAAGPAAGRPDS